MIGTIGFPSFAVKCLNMPTFQTDTDQSGKTIYNVWGMRQRSETVPQMDGETLTVVTGRTLGFLVVSCYNLNCMFMYNYINVFIN